MIVSAVPVPQATQAVESGKLDLAGAGAMTLRQFFEERWLPFKRRQFKRAKVRLYRLAVNDFIVFRGHDPILAALNRKDLDGFPAWFHQTYGGNHSTADKRRHTVLEILRWFDPVTFDLPRRESKRGKPRAPRPKKPPVELTEPRYSSPVDPPPEAGQRLLAYFEGTFKPAKEAAGDWKSELTERQFRVCINLLSRYMGRPVGVNEIEPGLLDRFAGWCKDHGISEGVAKKYLGTLETLMRHHRPEDFPKAPTYTRPAPMPRIPQPPAPPESDWTKAGQVQQVNPAWTDWTLRRYLAEQYATTHEMCAMRRQNMAALVERFSRWLGRQAELSDLTDSTVNRWLSALGEGQRAKATIHNNRGELLALWNDAFANCVVQHPPRRVRKIKLPRTLPTAWNEGEILRLLAAAEEVPGWFRRSRVAKGPFWVALIMTAYDTGLRQGDLLRLRRDQIDASGHLRTIQHKTGNEILSRVHLVPTLAAIEATYPPRRKFIFGGVLYASRLQRAFQQIVKAAGLVGSFKKLRKSGATAVEKETPGAATAFLGHRSPQVAAMHYVDPTIARQEVRLPPSLDR
ncbi:MAG: tyrosine-type recombinase/integrase [Pirellulales bacterium]